MINKNDLAYAAGYIDGDGCFYIGKHKRKYVSSLIISSTNKDILIWFRKSFGGTIRTAKKSADRSHHKQLYYFTMKKQKSIEFTRLIIVYLIEKYLEGLTFLNFSTSFDDKKRLQYISDMKILKEHTNLVHKQFKNKFESERNTIQPTEQDFAYLAGFIDAECCLGIQKYKCKNKPNYLYKIHLQCTNTKTPTIEWILKRFGGSISFVDRKSKNSLHRDQFNWRINSKSLAEIIDKIYPFLKYKKPVCEELMKFIKITLPNGGARHTEVFRTSYASIIAEREKIIHRVHLLNRKGI